MACSGRSRSDHPRFQFSIATWTERKVAAATFRSIQVAMENWKQGFSLLERPEHAIEEHIE